MMKRNDQPPNTSTKTFNKRQQLKSTLSYLWSAIAFLQQSFYSQVHKFINHSPLGISLGTSEGTSEGRSEGKLLLLGASDGNTDGNEAGASNGGGVICK